MVRAGFRRCWRGRDWVVEVSSGSILGPSRFIFWGAHVLVAFSLQFTLGLGRLGAFVPGPLFQFTLGLGRSGAIAPAAPFLVHSRSKSSLGAHMPLWHFLLSYLPSLLSGAERPEHVPAAAEPLTSVTGDRNPWVSPVGTMRSCGSLVSDHRYRQTSGGKPRLGSPGPGGPT